MIHLLNQLSKWSKIYHFSFQFWGRNNNNVFIEKDDVEIHSIGGEATPEDVIIKALNYVLRINQQPLIHKK
jgi:hypothetical protein